MRCPMQGRNGWFYLAGWLCTDQPMDLDEHLNNCQNCRRELTIIVQWPFFSGKDFTTEKLNRIGLSLEAVEPTTICRCGAEHAITEACPG